MCVHQKKFPPRRQKGLTKIGYVYIAVSRGGTTVQGRGKIQSSEEGGKMKKKLKNRIHTTFFVVCCYFSSKF